MKTLNKLKFLVYILVILLVAGIFIHNHNQKEEYKEIIIEKKAKDEIPIKDDLPTIDFTAIKKKYNNNDIVGAVRIQNSDFESLIFKSSNNTYYLNHNYAGKKGSGEVFIKKTTNLDNDKIKIIYGEGTNKTSFLKNYFSESYYNEHMYIEVETYKLIYRYKIFSIYQGVIDSKLDLNRIKSGSTYSTDIEVSSEDEIVIFRTKINGKYLNIVGKRV